jgi:hypothetical protein
VLARQPARQTEPAAILRRETLVGSAMRLRNASRYLAANRAVSNTDHRPWQRESLVMLNSAVVRLKSQIARLDREISTRGAKRPEQLTKLIAMRKDAQGRLATVLDEIARRLAQANQRAKRSIV